MEIKIKRFDELTTEELYEILQCRGEVFAVEQNIVYQDMDGIDKQSAHIFIIKDGRIASYLRLIDPGAKYKAASIGRVLTLKEFRGHGLARKLMIRAINEAFKTAPAIEIEAQAYLKDFYASLGFKAISDEFILEGIPHISMILERANEFTTKDP